MRNVEVVHGRARKWTDEQIATVNRGIRKTQSSVPRISGSFDGYLVLDGDNPIGMFTLIPTNQEGVIEVGVRFWEERSDIALILGRHLWKLFQEFPYVLARCYANNMSVRRLLQRAGFILLNVEKEYSRTLHLYGGRRIDFERVAPERIIN